MLPLKHIHHKKNGGIRKHSLDIFDQFIYLVAFAGPVMTIPQITDIWITKQTTVNITTWISYLVISSVWLFYGIKHKEKPIILSNILGLITNGLVVLGVSIFK